MDRIGPGAVLAGRYRLVERLEGDPVASLWQAEDTTLERRAAVRILAAGHSHVDATLDAARRSAVIDDPRWQRVLGVGVEAGAGYVILEWLEGPTAVQLAGRVNEDEACRVSFEVADALANARSKGLRHARLTPGHVRRGADGRVRISGLGVDAALIGRGIEPTREDTDVADTVALLYALISGRWPFGFVEGLLGAPYQSGKPVPLRELTTAVSSAVEELCIRTFAGQPPATPVILAAMLQARLRRPVAPDGAAAESAAGSTAGLASGAGAAAGGPVRAGSSPPVAVAGAAVTGAAVVGVRTETAAATAAGGTSGAATAAGPFARPGPPPVVEPELSGPSVATPDAVSDPFPASMDGRSAGSHPPQVQPVDTSERTVELTTDRTPTRVNDPAERTVELTDHTPPQVNDPAERTDHTMAGRADAVELTDGTARRPESDERAVGMSPAAAAAAESTPLPTTASSSDGIPSPFAVPGAGAAAAAASGAGVGGAVVGSAPPTAVPSLFTRAAPASAAAMSATTPAAIPAGQPARRAEASQSADTDERQSSIPDHRLTIEATREPAGHTVELPDVRGAAVAPPTMGSAVDNTPRQIPVALSNDAPEDGAAAVASVLPQSQRRGRTVTLPDAIEGHTRIPQWRRASDAVLTGATGTARKSGMQWSADPDDGWSLLPGEARGPEDPDWRAGRGMPAGDVPPYDDDGQWDMAGEDYDEHRSRRRRSIVGAVVMLAVLGFVVGGGIWAFNRADIVGSPTAEGTPTVTVIEGEGASAPAAVAEEPQPAAPVAVTAVGVQPLDPPPGDNSERDAEAPAAIDGDPATAWSTETYNAQNFGGLKSGVGLLVSLGQPSTVTSATLTVPGAGGTFEIRSSAQPDFDGSTVIATGETSDGGPVTLNWDPVDAPYLIVWFTALPDAGGEWRGTIAEIQLA